MTREERAYNYASKKNPSKFTVGEIAKHYDDGYTDGYNDAINKACKWLKVNYTEYLNNTRIGISIDEMIEDFKKDMKVEDGETYVVDGESSSLKEFVDNFKKAMEEQK